MQQTEQQTPKAKKSVTREVIEWVATFVLPVVFVLILHRFIFTLAVVNETSMLETLQDGQYLAVSRIHYRVVEPARGDIITCNYPDEGKKLFVKRIVGLPGDKIGISDGLVLINDEPLFEPYVVYSSHEYLEPVTLGPDEYFVCGDNRAVSLDSRMVGPITRSQVDGFVFAAVYPFNEMHWFHGQ